jgi:hypothetical protein
MEAKSWTKVVLIVFFLAVCPSRPSGEGVAVFGAQKSDCRPSEASPRTAETPAGVRSLPGEPGREREEVAPDPCR